MSKNTDKNIKKNNEGKGKKIVAFVVIGILVFTMIFGSFSYLIYALQSV